MSDLVVYSIMRQLISILLIQALVLLPFQGYALSERCCGIENELQTTASQSSDSGTMDGSCCFGAEPDQESVDKQYPDTPCEDGQCPSRCCTAVAHPAFVLPSTARWIVTRLPDLQDSPKVELDLTQPHLLRLKRPPRLV